MSEADRQSKLADAELVGGVRSGSAAAFDELVERHRKRLYRLAFAMTQDHDMADDLSQEAFVQAFKQIRQLKNPESFGPWLRKILVNLCARRAVAKPHVPLMESDLVEAEAPDTPHAAAERGIVRRSVRDAVSELEPTERAVVLLYYMEGLKQAEIADVLGCPVGTVWSRLSSARTKLRGRLAGLMDVAEDCGGL